MFDKAKVLSLGIPREKKLLGLALKGSNVALSDGAAESEVAQLVEALCSSPRPLEVELGALAPYLEELRAALAQAREGQSLYFERESPAPWRSYAEDGEQSGALEQLCAACRLPISRGGALMPDAHKGYGLPIGGVLAVKNAVIPYAVGVDIACRMRLSVLDIPVEEYALRQEQFKEALERQTRFGVGAHFERGEYLEHEVMADPLWQKLEVLKNHSEKALAQLGTSGSGNHFVELGTLNVPCDLSEPALTLKAGSYLALLSHSGSRGAGESVAEFYSALALSYHHELPSELKHLAWLTLDTAPGQEYWEAMQLMGRYAAANHELIHRRVIDYLGCGSLGMVENHHNFAWREHYDGEELIVHRKGATPAGQGVLGVVPGSMGAAGFVVRGRGERASYASCSHGAGRVMSRKAAFKTLSAARMQEILSEKGITLLSGQLDESPEVYRDIEQVMRAQCDLVDVLARFEPRLVKMAP